MGAAANIVRTYNLATDDERSQGTTWYREAHTFATSLADRHGLTIRQSAGIVAALSPRVPWALNVRLAETLATTGTCGTIRSNVVKAQRIRQGEDPETVFAPPPGRPTSGAKVRAFYACILNPDTDVVCIDRHAYDITVGRVTNDRTRKALDRVGEYEKVAAAYVSAARRLGVPAAVVQATTWLVWRRLNTVPRHRWHVDQPNPAALAA